VEYFKTYLWFKMHNSPPLDKDLSDEEWKNNANLYWSRFTHLEERLPKKVYQLFKSRSFHDATLKGLNIKQSNHKYKNVVNLEISITDSEGDWIVTYSNVLTFNLKYMEQTIGQGFNDWAYDELLDFNDKYLSHEIIFASGALVHVIFPDKNIKVEKL